MLPHAIVCGIAANGEGKANVDFISIIVQIYLFMQFNKSCLARSANHCCGKQICLLQNEMELKLQQKQMRQLQWSGIKLLN